MQHFDASPNLPVGPLHEQRCPRCAQLEQLILALEQRNREVEAALEQQQARLEALEAGRKGPPPAGGADASTQKKALPDWVKANRPKLDKAARKERPHGFARQRQLEPTRTVEHACQSCPDCGHELSGGTLHRVREVIDLPDVPVEIVHHKVIARHCGVCRKRVLPTLDLSQDVVGANRFGIRLQSLVAYLHTTGRMAHRGIKELLAAAYGLQVSVGQISEILHGVAGKGQATYRELLAAIRTSAYVHCDETGWRENGRNGYLWSLSTPTARLVHRAPSRAGEVIRSLLGKDFAGVLISDFYAGYRWYLGEHQWCWVHFVRDLRKLAEDNAQDQAVVQWVADMRALYKRASRYRNSDPHARRRARFAFQEAITALCRPLWATQSPARTLAERGRDFLPGLFTFVEYPDVPSHNNPAEQSVRPCVISRKTCGGTRSEKGSRTRSVLFSLFGTWALRKLNPLVEVSRMLRRPLQAAAAASA